jgi:hypothetical protein
LVIKLDDIDDLVQHVHGGPEKKKVNRNDRLRKPG